MNAINNSRLETESLAKKNILNKLKKQVEGADYSKLPKEPSYTYPELNKKAQIAQFMTHLLNNHAEIIQTTKENISTNIENILKSLNITSLIYGKDTIYSEYIEQIELTVNLSAFGFSLEGNKDKLFNHTPASVTSSYAAIAATGSIVRWPTSNEPRSMSLVPPVHIIIVDADELYSDFASLISAQQWQDKLPTNVLLISGPSKTADIQQTLAYGAHGPEKLFVLLLNS